MEVSARTLRGVVGPMDLVGRWDGNRFLVLLYHVEDTTLQRAVARVEALLSASSVPAGGERLEAEFSVGATPTRPADTLESLTARIEAFLR